MSWWFFLVCGALDGECRNVISTVTLVTHLIKGTKLGVEVQDFTESIKERLAGALATFISVDNARALVTMGELAQFKDVHEVVSPSFNKEVYKDAAVILR